MGAGWQLRLEALYADFEELKRRNVTYDQLPGRQKEIGVIEAPTVIANKINCGRFTAVFLIQCLIVIECSALRLEDG
jgi:hypothetical protein